MWQNSALLLGVIFAAAWGAESELDIVLRQGSETRDAPSRLDVDEGTYFTLKCMLAPPLSDGDPVWKAVGNVVRTESDELAFHPVRLEDRGEYLCLDRKGNRYKSVMINVAPRNSVEDLSPPLRKLYEEVRKIAKEEKLNLIGVTIPREEDYLNDEGYAEKPYRAQTQKIDTEVFSGGEEKTTSVKGTTTQSEVEVEEKLTVAPLVEEGANERDSTTTTKTEEYVEDLYEDYEFDDNPNQGEEVTAKDKSYANAANFMYTVDKNPSDENVFFDHHEPNMLFNRFGGEPIGRIPIGLNDIYADYMDNRDSIPKEQETVIVTEPPLEIESKTSRKDWVAINLNDLRRPSHEKDKEISTKPPEHATKSATPTEATTVQSMESTVDKINREVHDMMLFKYIVYALLLILVILLLAFIIRIWHLLEYKSSNDFPPPATQYVKLPQPVTLPTVEDGTESLLP